MTLSTPKDPFDEANPANDLAKPSRYLLVSIEHQGKRICHFKTLNPRRAVAYFQSYYKTRHGFGMISVGVLLLLSIFFYANDSMRWQVNAWAANVFPTPTNTVAQELAILRRKLEMARNAADQQAMIESLETMYTLTPYNEGIAEALADLYYQQGLILRNGGNFEGAQRAFNQALTVQETFDRAQLEQKQVAHYLTGLDHFQQGRWAKAIAEFEEIYAQNPDYPFMREILYSAYYNEGIALEANRDWPAALEAFKQAAEIMPIVTEASVKIAEVSLLLNPPTPTPAPTATPMPTATPNSAKEKSVVVDISEQRAYTYLSGDLVHTFIISTGEPGRDTAIGQYKIQNKIPLAYASTWNLDMPYWLGIYWSGPLQNGFHAVPTVRHTGATMWDGYLGQRVSYGCVILSLADAKTLYDWVEVGTPVTIRW